MHCNVARTIQYSVDLSTQTYTQPVLLKYQKLAPKISADIRMVLQCIASRPLQRHACRYTVDIGVLTNKKISCSETICCRQSQFYRTYRWCNHPANASIKRRRLQIRCRFLSKGSTDGRIAYSPPYTSVCLFVPCPSF